jgi:hypothetical protein
VWSLQAPRKIQSFIWKACNNAIPINKNLFNRGIISCSTCVVCTDEVESISHILWGYTFAQATWEQSNLGHMLSMPVMVNFFDLFKHVAQVGHAREVALFAILAWNLWKHRNNKLHGNSNDTPQGLIYKAEQFKKIYEDSGTRKEDNVAVNQTSTIIPHWTPPTAGTYKLNVAVTLNQSLGKGGLGLLVCNQVGWVAAACSEPFPFSLDPLLSRPQALLRTLIFARDAGFLDFTIEGDCKALVLALQCESEDISPKALILDDIHHVLGAFRSISFNLSSHHCNRAAKLLAEKACSQALPIVWLEEWPHTILNIVNIEALLC